MVSVASLNPVFSRSHRLTIRSGVLPGLALCCAVAGAADLIEAGERAIFGKAWLEALVLAILAGTVVRSLWTPDAKWRAGIAFGAKYLLEAAVALLGASVSAAAIASAGPALIAGIAGVVICAIPISFVLGKLLRLPTRMALLIACGNAICGNSAIAAVAPVIGAESEDVAASIAFTAVLGVMVVLGLPLLGLALGLSGIAYGALAGLTVYAVPQVLAAAGPFGATAVQLGTLVKLVRVLMLGPVCLILSVVTARLARDDSHRTQAVRGRRPPLTRLVPWFIIGFLILAACRSIGLVPAAALVPMSTLATFLTVVSMAALGLGVDVRQLAAAGGRVTLVAILSLASLGLLSAALIYGLGIA